MPFNCPLQNLFYFHLTVLYLYVLYLNGLGKLQEGVFKHAKLTLHNQLGSIMHLYLTTYNNPYFWRSGVYRKQAIPNFAQECTDSSEHRAAVRIKEGQGEREKEKRKIRVATSFLWGCMETQRVRRDVADTQYWGSEKAIAETWLARLSFQANVIFFPLGAAGSQSQVSSPWGKMGLQGSFWGKGNPESWEGASRSRYGCGAVQTQLRQCNEKE